MEPERRSMHCDISSLIIGNAKLAGAITLSSEPICVAKLDNVLGEGPCWDEASGRLYWFDIKGLRLHWLDHSSQAVDFASLPYRGSAAAPINRRPSPARTLRREVRCARAREECSNSRSMERIVMPSGIQEEPGGLPQLFLEMSQPPAARIQHRDVRFLRGGESNGFGVLRDLDRDDGIDLL